MGRRGLRLFEFSTRRTMKENRKFLKSDAWKDLDKFETDQRKGKPRPPVEKPYPEGAELIDLIPIDDISLGGDSLKDLIGGRKSHRFYTEEPLTLEELSFLLWATQGIREISPDGKRYYRNAPSGGNRHSIETYVSAHRVEGLEIGLYRYLPIEHKLLPVRLEPGIPDETSAGLRNQVKDVAGKPYVYTQECAVAFIWTTIPYRTEWRYGVVSHRMIAIDAGHICQNLYLACGAIGAGACAMGMIDQEKMDHMLGVDGEDEFTLYAATVGKVS
jgi:SagB-type dehydrogenase family enzyme